MVLIDLWVFFVDWSVLEKLGEVVVLSVVWVVVDGFVSVGV